MSKNAKIFVCDFCIWPKSGRFCLVFTVLSPLAKFLLVLLAESLYLPIKLYISGASVLAIRLQITALLYQFDVVSLISVLHWSDRFGSLQSVVPLQSDASSVVFHPTERYSWHSARAFSSLLQLHVHVATCVILVNRLLIVLRLVACTL